MTVPEYLYHATTYKAWLKIRKEGLVPAFPAVYMTDDLEAAKYFAKLRSKDMILAGDKLKEVRNIKTIVIRVKTDNLDREQLGQAHEMLCDIINTTDFWHYYKQIPATELERIL